MNVRELRASGPIDLLDAASRAVRAMGIADVARAWVAGAVPAAVLVVLYFLERVESLRSFRFIAAFFLVVAWSIRTLVLRRIAVSIVRATAPEIEIKGQSVGNALLVGFIAGAGLWCWLWFFVLIAEATPYACIPLMPLLGLRGAVAPSWLARSGVVDEGAFASWGNAIRDTGQSRASGLLAETMLLLGVLGVGINLYLIAGFAVSMGRTYFGFDLALVESFVSLRNGFVLVVFACIAFVLVEPYRAVLSALHFIGARARTEGIDLSASIDAAVAHTRLRRTGAAVSVLLVCAMAGHAVAQDTPDLKDPQNVLIVGEEVKPDVEPPPPTARDLEVREEVVQILERPEFREFEDDDSSNFLDELRRMLNRQLDDADPDVNTAPVGIAGAGLPGAQVFLIIAGVFLLVVLVALFLGLVKEKESVQEVALATAVADLREQAPTVFLDEASQLAAQGRYREALRSLYLATLVALDRQRLISFDPHLTNWQYMRQMPRSEVRDLFGRFTRAFDFKWYGQEPTLEEDYLTCRALADRICAPAVEAAA